MSDAHRARPLAAAWIRTAACAVVAGALSSGCAPGTKRLDEHVFHESPELALKVVRYHENLPFHYTGEIYVVQCRSEATRGFPEHATQDAGWRALGRGGAIGSESARGVADEVAGRYRAEGRVLVWLGVVFQVSFDACGSFAMWDPSTLPASAIDPVEKPEWCAPEGTGDCRYYDFQGEGREPVYRDVAVTADGRVRFTVATPAFRGVEALHVASEDSGRTWDVTPVPLAAGG